MIPGNPAPADRLDRLILLVRGHKVILDADLAALYGVTTKALKQAVRRHRDRFSADFMFELTLEEADRYSRSQSVTLNRGGNVKYRPFAFTEQGLAMLSGVLHSARAVRANIGIMRAFMRLREMLSHHRELARKLEALEGRYDAQFKVVFDAIRQLMEPPPGPPKPRIGFHRP